MGFSQPLSLSDARTIRRAGLATLLFAVVHSILASRRAKRIAGQVVGERRTEGTYRLAFNVQATVTTGWLLLYLCRLPDRTVYKISGPVAWAMRTAQLISILGLTRCLQAVGFANMFGINRYVRYCIDGDPGPLTIEAQGPAITPSGELSIVGPFEFHRHPMNFWPLLLLWGQPSMTLSSLTFTMITSLYLLLGSYHQDSRVAETCEDEYRLYRNRVPLFVPRSEVFLSLPPGLRQIPGAQQT